MKTNNIRRPVNEILVSKMNTEYNGNRWFGKQFSSWKMNLKRHKTRPCFAQVIGIKHIGISEICLMIEVRKRKSLLMEFIKV